MKARANTRVDILSGTATDSFGDPKDTTTTLLEDVTASIIERSKTVTNPDDNSVRIVRYLVCRLPSGTAVTTSMRLRDQKTGFIYIIDSVNQSMSPVRGDDLRLELRRVS